MGSAGLDLGPRPAPAHCVVVGGLLTSLSFGFLAREMVAETVPALGGMSSDQSGAQRRAGHHPRAQSVLTDVTCVSDRFLPGHPGGRHPTAVVSLSEAGEWLGVTAAVSS